MKAQFRMDVFNLFNHPVMGFNANQGNVCIDCGGNAGQITDIEADSSPGSTTGMRQIEFALRSSRSKRVISHSQRDSFGSPSFY